MIIIYAFESLYEIDSKISLSFWVLLTVIMQGIVGLLQRKPASGTVVNKNVSSSALTRLTKVGSQVAVRF